MIRQNVDQLAQLRQAVLIVLHRIVRDAAHLGVGARSAEGLGIDRLAGRALHEVRAAEAHERRALDHHDQIGERRQIRAAGDALPHHRGELRNAQVPAHDGVVVEDAARAVLTGEDAALVGEVHAGRVDEVHDGHAAAHRHFLRPEDLANRLRPPRAGLHGGVVRHEHDRPPMHEPESRDDPGGRCLAVVLVVGDQEPELDEA
jgi:hypothetical protein